jgi:peptide/nickel transport system substrate-binding protein
MRILLRLLRILSRLALLPMGAALLLGGCLAAPGRLAAAARTPTPLAVTPAAGRGSEDTLVLLYWQAPTILNPHLSPATKDRAAARITYEPLASYDREGNLVPFLAAEIPSVQNGGVAPDGKSVTWKLKPDIRWSDGRPFTSDDVLFTYEFATNPAVHAATAPSYSGVQSIELPDDHTVRINFKELTPAWALPFVGPQGMILPRHAFAGYADPLQAPANKLPIGTGPYRMVSFKPQEVLLLGHELLETNKIVYEPNPYFRDPTKPYFSQVVLKGGGTVDEAARSVFQVGDVDFTHNLQLMDPAKLASLQAAAGSARGHLVSHFGAYVERILLNRTDPNQATEDGERSSARFPNPLFSDLRVRQAFSYAIDRDAIAQIYGPAGRATANILVAPEIYASPNTHYAYNPDQARALLDAAGWRDTDGDGVRERAGRHLSVSYQTTVNSERQRVQEIVKDDLEAIGVEVKLKIVDSSIFFSNDPNNTVTSSHFYADMEQFANGSSSPDPGPYMKLWTCAELAQKANDWMGRNLERWCDPAYDALYAQAAREMDPARRRQLFIQMNDMLIDDIVMIPIGHRAEVFGVSNTLQGVNLTPWDAETWNIQDWRRATP